MSSSMLHTMSDLMKVQFLTKTDSVAETLRLEILAGSVTAGTQLRQEEVAERLGVSSTPVREAFAILEAEGFLERRPHRGVVVVRPEHRSIEEAYEIREFLEALAARRFIERKHLEALDQLGGAVRAGAEAMRAVEVHRFRLLGSEFHSILTRGSGSDTLIEVHSLLQRRSIFHPPLGRAGMRRVQRDHEAILDSLRRRATSEAIDLVVKHMRWNAEIVRRARKARGTEVGVAVV